MGDNDALLKLALGTLGVVSVFTLFAALVNTSESGRKTSSYESAANEYRVAAMRSISSSGSNLSSPLISKSAIEDKALDKHAGGTKSKEEFKA